MKKNCWEFKECGRRRGGCEKSPGKCPVPEMVNSNGINGGKNAGRICWLIAHTMCKGEDGNTFAEMIRTCSKCEFYELVKKEEGKDMILPIDLLQSTYEDARTRRSDKDRDDDSA